MVLHSVPRLVAYPALRCRVRHESALGCTTPSSDLPKVCLVGGIVQYAMLVAPHDVTEYNTAHLYIIGNG